MEPTLVGAYWDRHADTAKLTLGQMQAAKLSQATARAAVNLCLVRRANRDGHVMRSFEIPAVGGFMIAEDTAEHREIFGPEGECVLYFAGPIEAAAKTKWALAHPDDRRRMAKECHRRITSGAHTYGDRLHTMLEAIR
ncbi:MAG: glycosyltransferase [Usitatibacteraceae bacterium]